jgi:outer membrane protein TolC
MGFFRLRNALVAGFALCVCTAAPLAAQEPPPVPAGPLTLEQVLDLAQTRSEAVAIALAGIRRAEGEQARARSGRYPQLGASASYDRSLANEFEGVFDDVSVGGGSDEGGGFEDLPFGRANTWRVSLSLSQNLFSGGRLVAQDAIAAAGREAADLAVTTTRGQLLYEVTQAYYDAALSNRLVGIAEATLDQAAATLRQTQVSFEAGTQPEFEVLRARVARDNQTPVVIRQRINREVAMLRLKQLLDLPPDYDLRLADALEDEVLAPPPAFAPRVASLELEMRSMDAAAFPVALQGDTALPERTAVDEAAATVRLREASLALVEAQRRPAVSLNSTYSRIGYPTTGFPLFDRSNWSVGASVTVPVLTGGRQRADETVARTELEQARLQLQQVQEVAALETRAAWAELFAARAAWEATAGTVQQATRAHEIADVRYRAGVSTQLELSDSRLLLQQAEANRAQAARDLQVARAQVALIPDLPLGTGAAAPRRLQPAPQVPVVPAQPPSGGQFRNAAAPGPASQVGTQ